MNICQIAGFLGAGKTTLMIQIGKSLGEAGTKVAIIVNEIGEIGVDGALIDAYGIPATEITQGCICCTLSGSLQNTLRILEKEYKPDVILIEPTGIALPSKINFLIRTSMVQVDRNIIVAIVDAYRADGLFQQTKSFFSRQISGANAVAINKVDLIDNGKLAEVEGLVKELEPEARIFHISAKKGKGVEELMDYIKIRE